MQKLRPTIRVEAKDLCTTPTFVFPLHQNGRVELLRQIFVSAVLQSAFEDATSKESEIRRIFSHEY